MTTREFINRNYGIASNRDRQCSSVFADRDGNIYSYGYHYPLLFTVNGQTFRNVRGYSNTTQRHIMWSRDVDAIDVELPAYTRLSDVTPEKIKTWIQSTIDQLNKEMEAKKRKDTWVYSNLMRMRDNAQAQLDQVK